MYTGGRLQGSIQTFCSSGLREEQIKMPSFTDRPLVPNSFTVKMMNVYFRI